MTFSESKMHRLRGLIERAEASPTCSEERLESLMIEYHQAEEAARRHNAFLQTPKSSIVCSLMADAPNVFRQLQIAVRHDMGPDFFPVGTLIHDTWTDPDDANHAPYEAPLRVVAYRRVPPYRYNGALLMRYRVVPGTFAFGEHVFLTKYDYGGLIRRNDPACRLHESLDLMHYLNTEEFSEAYGRTGYLAGCSEALKAVIAPQSLKVISTEVCDLDVDQEYLSQLAYYFFLPTPHELRLTFDGLQNGIYDRVYWEYFREEYDLEYFKKLGAVGRLPYGEPIVVDQNGVAQDYLCRGGWIDLVPTRTYAVTAEGKLTYRQLQDQCAIAPVCVIA